MLSAQGLAAWGQARVLFSSRGGCLAAQPTCSQLPKDTAPRVPQGKINFLCPLTFIVGLQTDHNEPLPVPNYTIRRSLQTATGLQSPWKERALLALRGLR